MRTGPGGHGVPSRSQGQRRTRLRPAHPGRAGQDRLRHRRLPQLVHGQDYGLERDDVSLEPGALYVQLSVRPVERLGRCIQRWRDEDEGRGRDARGGAVGGRGGGGGGGVSQTRYRLGPREVGGLAKVEGL